MWTYMRGLHQFSDTTELMGDPLSVLMEVTLRGFRAQCQHLQSYMESDFEI